MKKRTIAILSAAFAAILALGAPAAAWAEDDDPIILEAPENGIEVEAEAEDDALESLATMKSQVYTLASGTFNYTSSINAFRQYPSATKNGLYSLENTEVSRYSFRDCLYYYDLDTGTKTLLTTLPSSSYTYIDETALYYCTGGSIYRYLFDSNTESLYAKITLHGSSLQAFGVDPQGRIYTAETPKDSEAASEVVLRKADGTYISSAEKQTDYAIKQFDGFDNYGHFFYEAYYNWVYWGYNHMGISVEMGTVTNNKVDMTPLGNSASVGMVTSNLNCLEYVCQEYYYRHQLGAQVFAGRYLVTYSVTFSRVQIFDMKEMALVASLSRGRGTNSDTYSDLSSVGVKAAYSATRNTLLLVNGDGYLQEMNLSTGEVYCKYSTAHEVFNMWMKGDSLIMMELDGTSIGYVEVADFSVPATVKITGSASMTVGDFQQLDCNMPVKTWKVSGSAVTLSEDGVVSAWKVGTATVTASTIDGRTAKLTIKVADNGTVSHAAMTAQTGGTTSNNIHDNNYTVWNNPICSYNYESSGGNITRVEYVDGTGVVVEVYGSASNKAISKKTLSMELPLFGGFFAGETYNFLVEGSSNSAESDDAEVIRVIKYDKNWNRLGDLKIKGINTTVPFDAGSVSMTELNGVLYIHTCHEMYTSSDGYNHQANMSFVVQESDMSLTSSSTAVSNSSTGYVSHSFNQLVLTDGTYLFRVDHGDYSPRSVFVSRIDADAAVGGSVGYANVLSLSYNNSYHYNYTGASVGGAAYSSQNVLVVGNSVDQKIEGITPFDARNIYVAMVDRDFNAANVVWLTDYAADSTVVTETPQLVKINDEHFLVMWEEHTKYQSDYSTRIVAIDGAGNVGASYVFAGARLSDCQPILTSTGLVTWYVTDGTTCKRYWIDPYHLSAAKLGDVNVNGTVNVVDAQLAYDVSCGKFTGSAYADLRLRADVTGDGKVYAEDAWAIQSAVVRGW